MLPVRWGSASSKWWIGRSSEGGGFDPHFSFRVTSLPLPSRASRPFAPALPNPLDAPNPAIPPLATGHTFPSRPIRHASAGLVAPPIRHATPRRAASPLTTFQSRPPPARRRSFPPHTPPLDEPPRTSPGRSAPLDRPDLPSPLLTTNRPHPILTARPFAPRHPGPERRTGPKRD